jgi:hypothetical protein
MRPIWTTQSNSYGFSLWNFLTTIIRKLFELIDGFSFSISDISLIREYLHHWLSILLFFGKSKQIKMHSKNFLRKCANVEWNETISLNQQLTDKRIRRFSHHRQMKTLNQRRRRYIIVCLFLACRKPCLFSRLNHEYYLSKYVYVY